MSEHLALRSSVGSRSSVLPSHHHQRIPPAHDPLASVWIRRLHLTPNPPPPLRPSPAPPLLHRRATPPSHQDAVSTDESRTPPPPLPAPPRSAGFGPFRWSPRPLRGAPLGAWDTASAAAVRASAGGGAVRGSPPMLSPFFRLPAPPPVTPVADVGEIVPTRPLIGLGSHTGSSGFSGLSPPMVTGGNPRATWLVARAAGAAYPIPSHALDMIPIRTLDDQHDRQHGVIQGPPNLARYDASSSSQHDEPFSYWNMGRFRKNTTTSSITPIGVAPANVGTKRNADSNNFLPLKFRKLSGGYLELDEISGRRFSEMHKKHREYAVIWNSM